MKAITANRLHDGRVVYLAEDDSWTNQPDAAAAFGVDVADAALTAAQHRSGEIADAYLIDIDRSGFTGRAAMRETIRSRGPTVRPDLARTETIR